MPPKWTDPTADKLARGPVKAEDIEAARHELDRTERRVSRDLRIAAVRREREVVRRQRSASPAPMR
jgi:hypothetical protein